MKDSYKTVKGIKRIEHRAKDSRFIATLLPVTSKEKVVENLKRMKEELPGASHHVYAYNYLEDGESIVRESDDGEPAGSSGPPLARVLKGSDLCNVMLVVTRYFGGTKLGLGGLARAYSQAGKLVLEQGEIVEVIPLYPLKVVVGYTLLGEVLKVLERLSQIKNVGHEGGRALVESYIKGEDVETLRREVEDASRGQASLHIERSVEKTIL